MASFIRWYQARLAARPLLTQSVTTAVLFATGDTCAQQLVDKKGFANQDMARTARMFGYGGIVFGPAATTWFGILQRKVVFPGRPNLELVSRVALDQLAFAPVIIGVFLTTMATLEGGSPKDKLESTYTTALTKNWMLWPWVQLANFKFVPLHHRVLTANVVSIGWNCYLSFLNNQGSAVKDAVTGKPKSKNPDLTPS